MSATASFLTRAMLTLTKHSSQPMTWHICDLFALQCQTWNPSFRRTPCPLRLVAEPYGADATIPSDLAAHFCPLFHFPSEVARDGWSAGWVSRRWHARYPITRGNGSGGRKNAKHFAVLTQLRMVRFCKYIRYLGLRQRPIQFL